MGRSGGSCARSSGTNLNHDQYDLTSTVGYSLVIQFSAKYNFRASLGGK